MSGADIDTGAVRAWCLAETARWHMRKPSFVSAVEQFRAWNEASHELFLFEIANGKVSIAPKRGVADGTERTQILHARAAAYRAFFQAAIEAHAPTLATMLVVGVADILRERGDVPLFTYQKRAGEEAILLPDPDFLTFGFYEAPQYRDDLAYDDKMDSAVFTGSTTGGPISMGTVRDLSLPRLKAARYFSGSPDVAFDLPNIVQCDSPDTAAALKALDLPSRSRSWPEQFRHKFLLSMDGNGATCSRVAIALASNCALLKYDSPHLLHYFSEMIPWRHYIPIATERDVEEIVALERRSPGLFRSVAEQGKAFHRRHLRRRGVLLYTASLLSAYAEVFA